MAVLIKILQLARFGFTPECYFKTSAKPLMFNKFINFSLKRPPAWSCWGIGLCVPVARFGGGLLPTSLALADCSAARRHKHINHLAGLWSRLLLPIPEIYSIFSNWAWRSLVMISVEKQTGQPGHGFSSLVFKGLGYGNFLHCGPPVSSGEPELWRRHN